MLQSTFIRLALFRRLTSRVTGQICNIHTTLAQRASDAISSSQESKLTSPSSSSSKIDSSSESPESVKSSVKDGELTEVDHWKKNDPGLMEFFDSPENWGEHVVRVGRSWRVEELRMKSNSDLHKLWFVLYKEKNMLLTMQEACKNEGQSFPSEERIEKVEESMENLEKVVRERNKAYFQLEVGEDATAERSMEFRMDQFGRWRWQPIYEHYKPFRASPTWRMLFGPSAGKDVTTFLRAYRERKRNAMFATLRSQHYIVKQLIRRFPNIDLDYLQRKYPKVPVQFYKDNLNFEPEYKRLISKGAYEELH